MSFEKASRTKLRFDFNGSLSTEDLWDFSKEQLAEYEVLLQERIEKHGKRSRFAKNAETAEDELRLSIVSRIVDIKVEEDQESAQAIIKKKEKERLLEVLAKKQAEQLLTLSEEEIRDRLKNL